jgi:hypothetical protein
VSITVAISISGLTFRFKKLIARTQSAIRMEQNVWQRAGAPHQATRSQLSKVAAL